MVAPVAPPPGLRVFLWFDWRMQVLLVSVVGLSIPRTRSPLEKVIPASWHFNCSSRETADRVAVSALRRRDFFNRPTTISRLIAGPFATPPRTLPFYLLSALQEVSPPGAPSVLC